MKNILVFVFVMLACTLYAQADDRRRKPNSIASSSQWQVELEQVAAADNDEATTVKKALSVYKSRVNSSQKRKVWIVDKKDGTKRILVQHAADTTRGNNIIVSPNGDLVFYAGVSPESQSIIYGLNLNTNEEFAVDSGSGFEVVECPQEKSYLVVRQNDEKELYAVYQLQNQEVDAMNIVYSGSIEDIKNRICY